MARRKIFKKSEFRNFSHCFTSIPDTGREWRAYLPAHKSLVLELGCGKAELLLELARRYPEKNFLGIDLKMDRMWYPAGIALEEGLTNVAFLALDLRNINTYLFENEAEEIWITFPDPFPKNRQAKHRMINPLFLKQYEQILQPGKSLHFKTDNLDLFHYALEVFVKQGNIRFHALSFDLHEAEHLAAETKILTTYEKAFLEMGMKINYVQMGFEV